MNERKSAGLVVGLLLVLVGGFLLAAEFVPGLSNWLDFVGWPVYVFGTALLLALIGVLTRQPAMAVPTAIVAGIGGILAWMNATGDWVAWSYAWALIPGFVGVGIIIAGLLGSADGRWAQVKDGLWTIFVSVVLFLIFGSFFGLNLLGAYWPVVLIVLGLALLVRTLVGHK